MFLFVWHCDCRIKTKPMRTPHETLQCSSEVRDTLKRFNFYDCPTPSPSPPLTPLLLPCWSCAKFMQLEIDIIQFWCAAETHDFDCHKKCHGLTAWLMCQCAFLCHNLHFYGNRKGAWHCVASSDLFKYFSAHHIEDNKSIVQQQIRIVRIKNFINHLILDYGLRVCVRPDKPTASSWTCETASCSACQQSLDAAGIRQRYKVINENTNSKIEQANRGRTTWTWRVVGQVERGQHKDQCAVTVRRVY